MPDSHNPCGGKAIATLVLGLPGPRGTRGHVCLCGDHCSRTLPRSAVPLWRELPAAGQDEQDRAKGWNSSY